MDKFDYDAPADLYWSDRQGPRKRPVMYRGFARSVEAICFAIEQLPLSAQPWAIIEMGDDRIEFTRPRALRQRALPADPRGWSTPRPRPGKRGTARRRESCAAAWPRKEWKIAMLSFPNFSRSYDATRHCIRFWGSDGAIEISFFLDESALIGIAVEPPSSEASLLESFDCNRERILKAARKVYERRRKGSYDLFASDLR